MKISAINFANTGIALQNFEKSSDFKNKTKSEKLTELFINSQPNSYMKAKAALLLDELFEVQKRKDTAVCIINYHEKRIADLEKTDSNDINSVMSAYRDIEALNIKINRKKKEIMSFQEGNAPILLLNKILELKSQETCDKYNSMM